MSGACGAHLLPAVLPLALVVPVVTVVPVAMGVPVVTVVPNAFVVPAVSVVAVVPVVPVVPVARAVSGEPPGSRRAAAAPAGGHDAVALARPCLTQEAQTRFRQ